MSSKLLISPTLRCGENQEFETDALRALLNCRILSIAGERDLNRTTELILDFLGLSFDSKPHHFLTASRDETRNITLTIPGISFQDQEGKKILATDKKMPEEIVLFLNQKGYHVLELSQLESQ